MHPRAAFRIWSDQENDEGRREKDRTEILMDTSVTPSTIQSDVGVRIVLQSISRHLAKANLRSKRPFHVLALKLKYREIRL